LSAPSLFDRIRHELARRYYSPATEKAYVQWARRFIRFHSGRHPRELGLGPGEGFIGERYVRLYPLEEIASANEAYAIGQYLPNHLLFGSDGCGNAFLFDLSSAERPVLVQPFIPLDLDFTEARYPNWSAFLHAALEVPDRFRPLVANTETHALEVHERHPIVLGGDPTDPGNKMLLPPPTHAEACTFFNNVVRSVRPK
jgi:Phage integrase, N-terminal SAM-like domain/SMI1 / KNR4 family (SUKH-1)